MPDNSYRYSPRRYYIEKLNTHEVYKCWVGNRTWHQILWSWGHYRRHPSMGSYICEYGCELVAQFSGDDSRQKAQDFIARIENLGELKNERI